MPNRRPYLHVLARGLIVAAFLLGPATARAVDAAPATAGLWIRVIGLNVTSLDRSVDFYTRLVGLKLVNRIDGKASHIAILNVSGQMWAKEPLIVLTQDAARAKPLDLGDGFSWIAFHVPDVDAAVGRIRAAGYAVTREPAQDPNVPRYFGNVRDPDGYSVELLTITKGPQTGG